MLLNRMQEKAVAEISDRFAPKGYGNVGCYDEEKYLNGKSLKSGKAFECQHP